MSGVDLEQIQKLLERVERLECKLAAAEREIERKDQIIAALQQRLFGSQSERLDPNQPDLPFEEDALGKPEPSSDRETRGDGEDGPEEESGGRKDRNVRRKKADLFPRNLPIVIDEVLVPAQVEADPDAFVKIGEQYHDELEAVRASLYWKRTVREQYKSKAERSLPPLIASAPEPSIPGTLCGPGLMARILVDKYRDHLPHYRQSDRFLRQHGVELSRQTLNKWTHAAADHLSPVGEAIKAELFESEVLEVDETPMNYLDPGQGKTSLGYLWTYLDPGRKIIYYDWQLGRSHDCLVDILGLGEGGEDGEDGEEASAFRGIIQCDGYSAYTALIKRYEGIRLGGCLAHIRRKFYEAKNQAPEVAMPILLEIQKLYRIERWLRQTKAPPQCRELVRRVRSCPIVDRLYESILKERSLHLPRTKLGEALSYALNQWESFTIYLEDGRLEIDNNLVENAIRPAKLGRKNYLFFGSAGAGDNSALLYTLMANCRAQGIDPERYLEVVFKRIPANATIEQAAALTPLQLTAKLGSATASEAA